MRLSTLPAPPRADEALDRFLADFRPVFPRADQFRRFGAYVRGLLEPGRRNAQAIAGRAAASDGLTQALQHFVGRSPWDADDLLAACRRRAADPAAVWVVHDGVFPKKGRHSAGAYRQLARTEGRKLGCQVGVFVTAVGPGGEFPLAARLYLPARWLTDNPRAAEGVPAAHRRPLARHDLAAALLSGLRAEGLTPAAVVPDDGYAGLAEAVAGWGWPVADDPAARRAAGRRLEWLKGAVGLDHYEGRTWAGWHHHVALAVVAYAYLTADGEGRV